MKREEREQALETVSLEQEVEELKRQIFRLLEPCIPPKEVREEILKNLYAIPLSLLKIIKTIVDYEVKLLEERMQSAERKPKTKKIKVE
ncbi:MAG: hypothetical protein GXO03_05555 [Aquificae bacterium]|nr:hypothetical protein [Aquificota bacterium]